MNTNQSTTATVERLKPIYGPSDPRWAELEAWLIENYDDRTGFIDGLTPSERVHWYEDKMLGNDVWGAQSEYPEVPAELVDAPRWATQRLDESIETLSEHPLVEFHTDLAVSEKIDFIVDLGRSDAFDPEAGTITKGAEVAQLWLGGNVVDPIGQKVVLDSPEKLRELARTLTEAADKWEQAADGGESR